MKGFRQMRATALRTLGLAIVLGALALAGAQAQSSERLEQIARSYAERGLFSGSVLVARGDEVLLSKGYGLASREWGIPNAPDVRFLLASVSKQFTAAAVLRLADQGRLALDGPLKAHLPGVPEAWSAITVRQLLAHTSGIPNHTRGDEFMRIMQLTTTPQELLATFRDRPLDFAPGSEMRYSNSGYIVLGLLIEALGGRSYDEFIAQELLRPLGMTDSGVAHSDVVTPRLASGYVKDGQVVRRAAYIDMSVPYAAGALYGTTGDLLKWQRGLYGGAVLSPAALKEMTTVVRSDYALGLGVGRSAGRTFYHHSGDINGFSTFLRYDPDSRLTVAVLGNVEGAAPRVLADKLALAARGGVVVLPEERRPVTLAPEMLARVEGTYQPAPEATLWVLRRGDVLWARLEHAAWSRLVPESATVFHLPDTDVELRFELGADGRARAVTVPTDTDGVPWPRVDVALPSLAAQPIFLRGSMNQWSTRHLLAFGADGLHRLTLDLAEGRHELKVASADWATIDLGRAGTQESLREQGTIALVAVGGNIVLQLAQPSRCEFTVDGHDIVEPRLSVACRAR